MERLGNKILKSLLIISVSVAALTPALALAHENYVLPKADIDHGMKDWSLNVFSVLRDPHNLLIGAGVGVCVLIIFILYYFFFTSKFGIWIDGQIKKLEPFGHVLLRTALALSFIASAHFNSFLGPEIPLASLPLGMALKPFLYILGILLLFGLFSEVAGLAGLVILIFLAIAYKGYTLTYFNYFGEFIALIFFGSRIFSLDKILFKTKVLPEKIKNWEIPIIRITYGISILYPAITIKILHPSIIVEIANRYHLTDIHWLFPPDPLLISLGTGFAQILVGLCLIFGFQTRLNSLITFALYVMSILFFKEAVWPHYILLALALYLAINNGGQWTIDEWILNKKSRQLKNFAA